MRFRIHGLSHSSGEPRCDLIIDAADEKAALAEATNKGMLVQRVEVEPHWFLLTALGVIAFLWVMISVFLAIVGAPLTLILEWTSSKEVTLERQRRYTQPEGVGRLGLERHYGCVSLVAALILTSLMAFGHYVIFE